MISEGEIDQIGTTQAPATKQGYSREDVAKFSSYLSVLISIDRRLRKEAKNAEKTNCSGKI